MLHHSVVGHLRAGTGEPSLARTYATSAPADKSQQVYIVVDPPNLIDNGEIQSGQVSPKKSLLMINIYGCAQHTTADLAPYAEKVKTLLGDRNYRITGFHIYGSLLRQELVLDFVSDPQGSETGVPSIKLMYSFGYGSRAT